MSEEELEEKLGEAVLRAADDAVPELISRLRESAPAMIAEHRNIRQGFEERLAERWRKALDLYQMVLTCACEMVAEFDHDHRDVAIRDQDFTFEVLNRLAVRACRVAGEILCLLRGGFADGAHARWRSLHELAATAFFIQKSGIDTAERYLLYEHIEAHKAACQLQEHVSKLNVPPFSSAELNGLKSNRDSLVQRYGNDFARSYGWAFEAFKTLDPAFRGRVTFAEIERRAGIGHLRPYYKMASNQVHAEPTRYGVHPWTDRDAPGKPRRRKQCRSCRAGARHRALTCSSTRDIARSQAAEYRTVNWP